MTRTLLFPLLGLLLGACSTAATTPATPVDTATLTPPKPILDGFTADPSIRLFGDTYYVYPTSDKPEWMTTDFSVWSSKNLVDWKKEGMVLDVAPTEFVIKGGDATFREGVVVFKRGGQYYFMWSVDDARSDNYRIAYGTAEHPYGPVTIAQNPIVLRKNGPAKGTGHHSVVNVPGTDRWYAVYHRHAIPVGGGYQRETCLARMVFRKDGSIVPMDPMVQTFKPGDRGEPIVNGKGLRKAP